MQSQISSFVWLNLRKTYARGNTIFIVQRTVEQISRQIYANKGRNVMLFRGTLLYYRAPDSDQSDWVYVDGGWI